MSEKIAELRALTDDDIVQRHDAHATNTVTSVSFYLDELRRREQVRAIEASNRLARRAFWLGVTNTVLALVAVIATVIAAG
jgi:CHASE3 domain sensor protein